LLLGGVASRTPMSGGRGAMGLDCKFSSISRVLFVKRSALSLDRRFLRARTAKVVSAYCTRHVFAYCTRKKKDNSRVFLIPLLFKKRKKE
jgi:hypothetical protein